MPNHLPCCLSDGTAMHKRHHPATSERNPCHAHYHVKKKPCHAQDTTLPHQKETLPRTRHHTATSERNPCHAQDTTLPRQKGTPATAGQDFATGKKQFENQKKHLVVTKKQFKKHVLRPKKSREQHLTDWKCTWQNSSATRGRPMLPYMSASQHQSRIGECQILRVGPFFMVEDLAKPKYTKIYQMITKDGKGWQIR